MVLCTEWCFLYFCKYFID